MQPEGDDLFPVEPAPIDDPVPEASVPDKKPFWGYMDLALVMGLLFAFIALILLAAAGLVLALPSLRRDQGPLLLPTQIAVYAATYFSLRVVFGLRYSKPVLTSLGWCAAKFNLILVGLGGIILAFVVSALASLIHTPKVASPAESLMSSPVLLSLFGVMAVTLAPFFEELLFRGFLQPLLTRSLGVIAGIVLTAAVFGSLHAPEYSFAWQYAVAVSLVGVVLGWLRVRSDSIIPCTVMHGAYNSVFVVALVISKFSPDK
ncbi:MAG: CPBP family intramembrane glutamic endopeptidase [Bryobacteraceae bacterium]